MRTSRRLRTRRPRGRAGACTCPAGTWCLCPAATPCPPACPCCCPPTPAPSSPPRAPQVALLHLCLTSRGGMARAEGALRLSGQTAHLGRACVRCVCACACLHSRHTEDPGGGQESGESGGSSGSRAGAGSLSPHL